MYVFVREGVANFVSPGVDEMEQPTEQQAYREVCV